MAKPVGKFVKAVGKVLSIPDAFDAVKHVTEKAGPIIEKELDRRYARKASLVQLDNVIDVPIDFAQSHLEAKGFTVLPILAQAHPRYANNRPMEVIKMIPSPGKHQRDQLVKLYFVTEQVITDSIALKDQQSHRVTKTVKAVTNQVKQLPTIKLPFKK